MAKGENDDVELAETFAAVARLLLVEHDVETTLDRICLLAVETVPGCEAAGISIASATRVTCHTTTAELPRIVDAIQSETQEGPCVDAIRKHGVFVTGSLSREPRWPRFARRAHEETGVESILSLRLFADEDTMGALNLYSALPDAFDDHDVALGSVFAAHAAVALASAHRQANLEAKAVTRDVIGMAKGIIMARQHVSEDEAFDVLRRASQRMNVKLRELASQVVHHPPPPEGAHQ
ncbi:MAG TPA: GAF and ANTAR domain-containing protein [Acidimicrobiales bacterium]